MYELEGRKGEEREWVRGRESDPRLSLAFVHSRQRLACGLLQPPLLCVR